MKFIFDAKQVMTASMLLNIDTKTLLDLVNVETLSRAERNRLLAHNGDLIEMDYADIIGCRIIYGAKSDTVFIYGSTPDIALDGVGLLVASYALLYTKSTASLQEVIARVREYHENVYTAKDYMSKIRNYENKINELLSRNFGGVRFLSVDEFLSACKKQKIKCNYDSGIFSLIFKKVRVGNELEGWINYKSITVRIDLSLNIKSTKFEFSSFFIDTAWNIYTVPNLHPHINQASSFCFGNRKTDFELYKKTFSYAFYLDLIRETVHSFSADSPYVHVNQIATTLSILETRLGLAHVQDREGNLISAEKNPELFSRRFIEHMGVLTCPHCGSYAHVNDAGHVTGCSNLSCAANPVAHRTCRNCGTTLERGEWSVSRTTYEWNCRNRQCRYYVADPEEAAEARRRLSPEGEGIPCLVCGEIMHADDSHLSSDGIFIECQGDTCPVRGLHQYTLTGLIAGTHSLNTFQVETMKYAMSCVTQNTEAKEYIMDIILPRIAGLPTLVRRNVFSVSYNSSSRNIRGYIDGSWYTIGNMKAVYDIYTRFFKSSENKITAETIKQYLISEGVTLDES